MATLYYWEWSTKKGNVGHISMKLDDGTYISLWPDERESIYTPLPITGELKETLKEDEEAEGRKADKTLQVPRELIKNVDLIKPWWEDHKKKGTWYNLAYGNCAQFVLKALIEGGLKFSLYQKLPGFASAEARRIHLLNPRPTRTPSDVFYLVNDLILGRWPAEI